MTGEGLGNILLTKLTTLGRLDIADLRGQGYDGAPTMSGRFNGCQAVVQRHQPLASYTHCFSHRVNLVISKACNLPAFRSMLVTVSQICDFFCNSPKRTKMLEDLVEADETVTAHKKRRLKSLCDTRCVERHHSIAILVELFPFVINVISMLDDEGDDRAVALLGAISRTNFVCALAVANEILAITPSKQCPAERHATPWGRLRPSEGAEPEVQRPQGAER